MGPAGPSQAVMNQSAASSPQLTEHLVFAFFIVKNGLEVDGSKVLDVDTHRVIGLTRTWPPPCVCGGGQTRLPALAEAVALATDVDRRGGMDQALREGDARKGSGLMEEPEGGRFPDRPGIWGWPRSRVPQRSWGVKGPFVRTRRVPGESCTGARPNPQDAAFRLAKVVRPGAGGQGWWLATGNRPVRSAGTSPAAARKPPATLAIAGAAS